MNALFQDIRYALRQLRKSPGFTLTAVLTLALGIAAATAIFSVVEAVLLRPLPFRDPQGLVLIQENVARLAEHMDLPAPDVLVFGRDAHDFESTGGFIRQPLELSGSGDPALVPAARMTAGVFPTLGIAPALGRVFTQQEDDQGETVAVLSHALWRERFQGDAAVIGKKVELDRKPYIIIGVMPREFEFPLAAGRLNQTQLWVPMSFTPAERSASADNFDYGLVARMKSGVTLQHARADADRVAKQIQASLPAATGIELSASVVALKENTVGQARPLLRVLLLSVLVVLLIACANLAGLLLVRAIRRRREIAMRLALGASNGMLVRQTMAESLLLSLCGGGLGILLASLTLRFWAGLLPDTLPRAQAVGLDWRVAGFAVAVTLATGLLCGMAPAFAALRANMNEALKESGRSAGGGAGHARLRSVLVTGEIAIALMLLAAAGLLLRSFEKMRNVDPGFQPDHAVVASISLPSVKYTTQGQVDGFEEELLRRLRQLPGVQSAALSSGLPMAEPSSTRMFTVEGYTPPPGAAVFNLEANAFVVGDFLRTMRIPLLRGRYFNDGDRADSPLVVIVNRSLAQQYWPGEDPIGKRIKWGPPDAPAKLPWLTVIGEVADTKQGALDSKTMAQAYEPIVQLAASFGPAAAQVGVHGREMRIAVRTATDAAAMEDAVRRAVWSLDPQLAVTRMQTMEEAISDTEAPRRFNTSVITAFALAAALLATLGIYSIIAFSVTQRVGEIAVRMAVGADRKDVLALVLKNGLQLALIACVIGIAGSLAATRLLQSMLFEVSPFDPLILGLATVGILLLALAASWLPARRAAAIDPMQALRNE